MSTEAIQLVLEAMAPAKCDCSGMSAAIKAHVDFVEAGQMSDAEAIDSFGEMVDFDCGGMKPRPDENSSITGCGVSEMICGHRKGANFLVRAAYEKRYSL